MTSVSHGTDVYVVLSFDGERAKFRASSHAMALACEKWAAMLRSPGSDAGSQEKVESRTTGISGLDQKDDSETLLCGKLDFLGLGTVVEKNPEGTMDEASTKNIISSTAQVVLDFTKNDGHAMVVLLSLAHHTLGKVPFNPEYRVLVEIARACDYYGCTLLTRFCLPIWMSNGASESIEAGKEEWLLIAWVFGENTIFEGLVKKLVLEVGTIEQGECIKDGKVISFELPPGIIDEIMKVRGSTIQRLLEIPYNKLRSFETCGKNNLCQEAFGSLCDSTVLGSLVRGLLAQSLFPVRSSNNIFCSVTKLFDDLKSMTIHKCSAHWTHGGGHHQCGFPFFPISIERGYGFDSISSDGSTSNSYATTKETFDGTQKDLSKRIFLVKKH